MAPQMPSSDDFGSDLNDGTLNAVASGSTPLTPASAPQRSSQATIVPSQGTIGTFTTPSNSATAPPSGSQAEDVDHISYRIPWGKHKGCLLCRANTSLQEAVKAHLIATTGNALRPLSQNVQTPSESFTSSQPVQSSSQQKGTPLLTRSPSLPTPESAPTASQPMQMFSPPAATGPYALNFGKHAGKFLSDVPVNYIEWLKTGEIIKTNAALAAAVAEHDQTLATAEMSVPKPPYTLNFGPHSGKRLEEVPAAYVIRLKTEGIVNINAELALAVAQWEQQPREHDNNRGPYEFTFGKHVGMTLDDVDADYIIWLKQNAVSQSNATLAVAIAKWEQAPAYVFRQGKHKGKTLDQVPISYLASLHKEAVKKGRSNLLQALKRQKVTSVAVQASNVEENKTMTNVRRMKPFKVPNDLTHDARRFYYNADPRASQMWISCQDCVRYFGADAKAMVAAGLRPHHNDQRYWLHQVFAFAEHFQTTGKETPFAALNRFKTKNGVKTPGGSGRVYASASVRRSGGWTLSGFGARF